MLKNFIQFPKLLHSVFHSCVLLLLFSISAVSQCVGGTVGTNQIICLGSQPNDLTLTGHTGTIDKWQKSTDAAFTIPVDIANTAATLTGAQIGNLSVNTYFRAVLTGGGGGCPANSAAATINVISNNIGLNFDGSNDYVVAGPNVQLDLSTGTIEAWVKTSPSGAGTSYRGIIAKPLAYGLYLNDNVLVMYDWSNGSVKNTNVTFVFDTWYHVAVSFAPGTNNTNIYINGALVLTTTYAISNQSQNLFIGSGGATIQYINGTIDEARVWNTVRTQAQIVATKDIELIGNESGLVLNYSLNQGVAGGNNVGLTNVTDKTANALNGILTNFTKTGSASNFVSANNPVLQTTTQITGLTAVCSSFTSQLSHVHSGGTWTSSDTAVATVNASTGLVSGIANGTATITYITTLPAGCTITVSTLVTVGTSATTINTQPSTSSQTLCLNESPIPLSVAATGGEPLTYQWYSNIANSNIGGTLVPGATSASLLPPTTSVGSNYYYAIVTNTNGCTNSSNVSGLISIRSDNHALNFDGTNDYVVMNNHTSLQLSTGTIEAWVKTSPSGAGSDYRGIISKPGAYGLYLKNNFLAMYDWSNNAEHIISTPLTANTWYHVAASFAPGANNTKIYLNGVVVATITYTVSNQSERLFVGSGGTSIQYLNGTIDEARVWNVVRTQAQIATTKDIELFGNEANLILNYSFNQGVASGNNGAITTVTDKTANPLNGTLTNFTKNGLSSNFVYANNIINPNIPQITGLAAVCLTFTSQLSHINSGGNWTSSNPSVATVDASTGLVSGLVAGTSTITYSFSTPGGCLKSVSTLVTVGSGSSTINTQPSGSIQTLCVNDVAIALTVVASGVSPLTYQWYSNITNSNTGGTLIVGATATTFLPPTQVATSTYYYVTVTNNAGCTISSSVSGLITVNALPPALVIKNALNFDGTNDFVNGGNNPQLQLSTGTIEAWVKTSPSGAGSGHRGIIAKPLAYGLYLLNNVLVAYDWSSGGDRNTMETLLPDTWYHVAMSFAPGPNNTKIYINGLLVLTTTYTISSQSENLFVGSGGSTIQYINGTIDEARVWNTPRTATEIANNISTEMSGIEAGLELNYTFNEGIANGNNTSINIVRDKTLNTFDGTLFNFAKTGTTSNFVAGNSVVSYASPITAVCSSGTVTLPNPFAGGVWSSSNTSVATVDPSTGVVTGVASGNAVITYTITNGSGCFSSVPTTVSVGIQTSNYDGTSWSPVHPNGTRSITFSATATISSAIAACACLVPSGINVTVASNTTLTLTNGLAVASAATMTFENGSSLVQTAISATNTGNIIYKRNTSIMSNNYDFTYWGSPVAGQTLGGIWMSVNSNDTFFSWNAFGNSWTPRFAANTMTPGVGYIARARNGSSGTDFAGLSTVYTTGAPWQSRFFGVPNNGNFTLAVSGASPTNDNLLANPYPSAIDIIAFRNDAGNVGQLTGNFYFWTHTTAINNNAYNASDYAIFNTTLNAGTGGSSGANPAPDRFVDAGQGFFAEGSADGTVTFKNSHRVPNNNNLFYRLNNANQTTNGLPESHKIWLNLTNAQGLFKQQMLTYSTGATLGYDQTMDAKTFDGNDYIDFYSRAANENLTIQSRSVPFTNTDLVPLGFKTSVAGHYKIAIDHKDGLFNTQTVYLQDNLLHSVHNLSLTPYNFTTAIGTFNNRFVLKYINTSLNTSKKTKSVNHLNVYKNNETIIVSSSIEKIEKIIIYDLMGRKVFEQSNLDTNKFGAKNITINEQILIVKVHLKNGAVNSTKVVF